MYTDWDILPPHKIKDVHPKWLVIILMLELHCAQNLQHDKLILSDIHVCGNLRDGMTENVLKILMKLSQRFVISQFFSK
jgi:hypothetical protein